MDPNAKKKLIGAVIAAALAIAVYYGFIDQKQATNLQNQANQTLGTGPAQQQATPQNQQTTAQVPAGQQAPTSTSPTQQAPAQQPAPPAAPAPQNTAPSQPK